MNEADQSRKSHADAVCLQIVRGICDTIASDASTVLDVGPLGTVILEWNRGSSRRLVSVDEREPAVAEGVESFIGDFLDYPLGDPFELVTCRHVLENVPEPAAFAQKLLNAGSVVVVAVPYLWPEGRCASHLHHAVDEQIMLTWFGRLPTSQYVAQEQSGERWLVQVYRTVAPPPRRQPPRLVTAPEGLAITIAHRARQPGGEWPLFSIVRDEAVLLPHFFRHYRSLGVDHFFIYDDQSTDETPALLRSQPDCTVLTSPHRFGDICGMAASGAAKRFCSVFRETVPVSLVPQGWAVLVDIDEFLILPPGVATLGQMCRLLDARGQSYAAAPNIDFYPESFAAHAAADVSPFEVCPYFDVGPLFEWNGLDIEPRKLFRGIRSRLYRFLAAAQPWVVDHVYGERPVEWMPKSWKIPLLRHGRGIARVGAHEISVPPATNCDVALAHFKFFADFHGKVSAAVEGGQYFNQSIHYRLLQAAIKAVGSRSLLGSESRRYDGPESLVAAKLLQPFH